MKRYSLKDVDSVKDRRIFFDTNILIFLFGTHTQDRYRQNLYAKLYKMLLSPKSLFYVDFIVVSEFINRLSRVEYENYLNFHNLQRSEFSYKKYRNTDEGTTTIKGIYSTAIDDILNKFLITGKQFIRKDLESFLQINDLDFSDKAIELVCKENNFVLFTDDRDFADSDIDILSANGSIVEQ